MENIRSIKPYVGIAVVDDKNLEIIKEITAGLEEEGVPWELRKFVDWDAVILACNSAAESILQVGIGVGKNGDAAVHYARLPFTEPLFFISYSDGNQDLWRILGSNAARLIKGMPFRQIGQEKQKLE
ncbi:MAG: hypothetical protein VR72_15875 [Clostridiaceae bacterium BRH_c20a]|nr:MAG: hypothetical protein VR72_15875 [Clostridiaceae bacterium BRH_c20a]